ncbi:MAG: hypothetical protein Tsb009_19930 [Planctomycetaceae bacterium]
MLSGCSWIAQLTGRYSTESRELSNRAQQAEDKGQFQTASRLLEKAIQADPSNPELHKKLANNHLKMGNRTAAAEQLRYAIAAQPDDVESYVKLARIFYQRRDYNRAEQAVQVALRHDPTDIDALMIQAQLHERRQEFSSATNAYHRILEAEPENSKAKLRLAHFQLKSQQPDKAALLLRSVCNCDQTNPVDKANAYWALGLAYKNLERWDDSATALANALKYIHQPTAEEWYQLASVRFQAGDVQQAERDLLEALKRDPNHPHALKLAQAIRSRRIAPNSGPVRFASNTNPPS